MIPGLVHDARIRILGLVALAALLGGAALGAGRTTGTALGALAVVILLGAGALAAAGRSQAAPARIAVIERLLLGRDTGVALVEAEGRRLLLGFGPGGVRAIGPASSDHGAQEHEE